MPNIVELKARILSWWFSINPEDRPSDVTINQAGDVCGVGVHDRSGQTVVGRAMVAAGFVRRYRGKGANYTSTAWMKQARRCSFVSNGDKFVYFAQSAVGGPIKIGSSSAVLRRLAELQTGSPFRLRLLVVVPVGPTTEKTLHERFDHLRIRGGEWFEPHDDLLDYIEEQVTTACGITV